MKLAGTATNVGRDRQAGRAELFGKSGEADSQALKARKSGRPGDADRQPGLGRQAGRARK